jgi:energy-coupling factor transport system permease protein
MSLSFFIPTGGFFERAHPVTKFLALICAFIPPFFSNHPLQVLPYFLLLLILGLASGARPNLARIKGIAVILFFVSSIMWTFFYPGQTPLVSVGPVTVHLESLLYGLTIGLRFNCFMFAAILFLTCTRIEDFTYGLSKLGIPFVASFAMSLAFRLTPLFMETGQTIVMAQRARGLDPDQGGPIRRLKQMVPILVPILVSGLRRADQLAMALESKGFGSKKKRTVLTQYKISWRDFVLIFSTVLIAVIMGLNYYR